MVCGPLRAGVSVWCRRAAAVRLSNSRLLPNRERPNGGRSAICRNSAPEPRYPTAANTSFRSSKRARFGIVPSDGAVEPAASAEARFGWVVGLTLVVPLQSREPDTRQALQARQSRRRLPAFAESRRGSANSTVARAAPPGHRAGRPRRL